MGMSEGLGILGGTFNPIHNGHIALAGLVRERLGLGRILLLPAGDPPHKPAGELARAEDRYAMCVLAASCDWLVASRLELDRAGVTYTVDTLRQLEAEEPLYYIVGDDTLMELQHWRRAPEVLQRATFVVAGRQSTPPEQVAREQARLTRDYGARILRLEWAGSPLSSTLVRDRVRAGLPLTDMVPPAVANYIADRGLYREDER